MSVTISSDVPPGLALTLQPVAVWNGWTQSYFFSTVPSCAYPSQMMMLSSPSPAPTLVGRLGPAGPAAPDGLAAADAVAAGAAVVGAAGAGAGLGVAALEQADATMPTTASVANRERVR